MTAYDFWITPEDYQIAEKNGIKKDSVDLRVRGYGWKKQRAITEPIRKFNKDFKKWVAIAQKNGIKKRTLVARLERGWEIERAATQSLANRRELLVSIAQKRRKYPREYVERALKNGINYPQFQWRVTHGWSLEDACKTKTLDRHEAAQRSLTPWRKIRTKF